MINKLYQFTRQLLSVFKDFHFVYAIMFSMVYYLINISSTCCILNIFSLLFFHGIYICQVLCQNSIYCQIDPHDYLLGVCSGKPMIQLFFIYSQNIVAIVVIIFVIIRIFYQLGLQGSCVVWYIIINLLFEKGEKILLRQPLSTVLVRTIQR